jgi:hypothetical protein
MVEPLPSNDSKKCCLLISIHVLTRDTREGKPMSTVENEANGDSRSTYERVLPWLVVRWARHTRDFCPALVALVGPIQNIFSSLYNISLYLSPLPNKLGRHPGSRAKLPFS